MYLVKSRRRLLSDLPAPTFFYEYRAFRPHSGGKSHAPCVIMVRDTGKSPGDFTGPLALALKIA
jgi:hypothetical protein